MGNSPAGCLTYLLIPISSGYRNHSPVWGDRNTKIRTLAAIELFATLPMALNSLHQLEFIVS